MQKIKDLQNVGALCVAGKKSIFHILSNRMQPTRPAPPLEDPAEPLIPAKPLIMAIQAKLDMNSSLASNIKIKLYTFGKVVSTL